MALSVEAVDEQEEAYGTSSGVCDSMEFYNRKALGSAARSNGMKLRPDEAKRRDMIMLKKEQQRQQAISSTTTPTTKSNKARSK